MGSRNVGQRCPGFGTEAARAGVVKYGGGCASSAAERGARTRTRRAGQGQSVGQRSRSKPGLLISDQNASSASTARLVPS
jgi:hypothetical protein